MRRTKIICTIGPSTESEEMTRELIASGMDVARLNFSHGTHQEHGQRIDRVRKWAKRLNKKVEILCDLQGPKIRISDFANAPIQLTAGDVIVLSTSSAPSFESGEIIIEDPYLHEDVKSKDILLIDDGQIELMAKEVKNHKIFARVLAGGDLYPRKGINLPYTETTTSSITDKDIADLKFILTRKPDWVAVSFVQNARDIERVRQIIGRRPIRVMCKIERAKAIDNIESIIEAADGIMVARGDLGVELPIEKLPIIQKQLIKRCNFADKPVVTATQMLATMTHVPFPGRAEVTDIANAVIDGTDAVMLSNETAVGQYPIQAVATMAKVITATENYLFHRQNKL